MAVIARGEPYLLAPQAPYERTGDVPNVAFPCAALVDGDTGRMAIYYGGADTVVCMAFAYVDEIVDFVKANASPCLVNGGYDWPASISDAIYNPWLQATKLASQNNAALQFPLSRVMTGE